MGKNKSKFDEVREQAEGALVQTNRLIDSLGIYTGEMYETLTDIQEVFDKIRNIPDSQRLQYEQIKNIRLEWKHQVEKIEEDYRKTVVQDARAGAAGVGAGVAFVAMGPNIAMGIATSFGVASTGTAISALSGAAATNAALAWLGGGALAAGGGGMVAGEAFLSLFGPVGWTIAGAAVLGSGLMLWKSKNDQRVLDDVFIAICKRDIKSYELARVEINERIVRIRKENKLLKDAIDRIRTFGFNYRVMTEEQQFLLGTYKNLVSSATQLLVNPILGLLPKYTEDDLLAYITGNINIDIMHLRKYKKLIISLANMLYKIDLSSKEIALLTKAFRKNEGYLKSVGINKHEFDRSIIYEAIDCLKFKYAYHQ